MTLGLGVWGGRVVLRVSVGATDQRNQLNCGTEILLRILY
jgi:hypothetical protein